MSHASSDAAQQPDRDELLQRARLQSLTFMSHRRRQFLARAASGDPMPYCLLQWPMLHPAGSPVLLDWFQQDMLTHAFSGRVREMFVKGCTGAGKGMAVAVLANLWFRVWPESRVIVSSSTHDHAKDNLFGEIVRWRRRMLDPGPGDVHVIQVREHERHYMTVTNPDRAESFSGHHGPHTLFLFDEACHDDETEVMTDSGWKHFSELLVGDQVLSMDSATRVARYVTPLAIHAFHHKGPMLLYEQRASNFCVTLTHDMLTTRARNRPLGRMKASDLKENYLLPRTATIDLPDLSFFTLPAFRGLRKNFPERTGPADLWIQLFAWFCSEGHIAYVRQRPYTIGITQKNMAVLEHVARIARLLGFRPKIYRTTTTPQLHIHDAGLASFCATLGCNATSKQIPEFIFRCSARQMLLFLHTYREGDGYIKHGRRANHSERWIFYTSSSRMADDLQRLIVCSGHNSTITRRPLAGVATVIGDHVATSRADGYVVSMSKPSFICYRRRNSRLVHYDGMVYCVTAPPHNTLLTRRKGCCLWSGNSASPDEFYEMALSQAKLIVAISNPRSMSGWFRDAFRAASDLNQTQTVQAATGMRRLITVPAGSLMNVREGRELIPSQLTRERADGLRERWARENPRLADVLLDAIFPEEDPHLQLIFAEWIERARTAWTPDLPVQGFGLDVAWSDGGDETVLAAGGKVGVRALLRWKRDDTMATVGRVIASCREQFGVRLDAGQVPICVDADGGGKGIADRLAELGCRVIQHFGGGSPENAQLYRNRRAETWGELARRLDPAGPWPEPWALPADSRLAADLAAPQKIYGSDGLKFGITPKDRAPGQDDSRGRTLRDLLGRSPDAGDAVAYLWAAVRTLDVAPPPCPMPTVSTDPGTADGKRMQESIDAWQRKLEQLLAR